MEYDLKIIDTVASSREDDDPAFPMIRFEGICRGAHSSVGRVEGTVRMFAPGVVRWNFVSHARSFSVNTSKGFDPRSTRSLLMMVARILGGEPEYTLILFHESISYSRFSAEGVQVGQVGSSFGMGGIWSVAVHEDGECLRVRAQRTLQLIVVQLEILQVSSTTPLPSCVTHSE